MKRKGVYIINYGVTWYLYFKVKIGKTSNYNGRLNAYRTHNFNAKFSFWRECRNESSFENKLHKRFKNQRVDKREFFVLNPLQYIWLILLHKFSKTK
jgi:hypothetical protein